MPGADLQLEGRGLRRDALIVAATKAAAASRKIPLIVIMTCLPRKNARPLRPLLLPSADCTDAHRVGDIADP